MRFDPARAGSFPPPLILQPWRDLSFLDWVKTYISVNRHLRRLASQKIARLEAQNRVALGRAGKISVKDCLGHTKNAQMPVAVVPVALTREIPTGKTSPSEIGYVRSKPSTVVITTFPPPSLHVIATAIAPAEISTLSDGVTGTISRVNPVRFPPALVNGFDAMIIS